MESWFKQGGRGGREVKVYINSLWTSFNHLSIHHSPTSQTPSFRLHHQISIIHQFSKMRLQILTLLCSLCVLVLATGKVEDKENIREILNLFSLLTDEKKYDKVDKVFTRDATFEPGEGPVKGTPAIANFLKNQIPDTVTTYSQTTTNLIKFVPPFDKEGRSDRAEAVSYTFVIFFGAGNSTKEYLLPIKYLDKEIVRTKEPGSGGWRIKKRKLEVVVSFNTSHKTPLCRLSSSSSSSSTSILFFQNSLLQYLVADPSNL